MASIIKRKSKYSVVYRYLDEAGHERQRWETFSTHADAKKRKKEVEYQQATNTFTMPTCKTVKDLMYDYVTIYGVNRQAFAALDGKDVILKFPSIKPTGSTVLVIKTPKTEKSTRRVYLPVSVAKMLLEHKQNQEEFKEFLGNEYHNYNLVIASTDGRPIEGQVVTRGFIRLIEENNLPKVVFHSLRHTSITYKLKLTGGDIKSVQGDSGHTQTQMISDVYSHIIDVDRSKMAQLVQDEFYGDVDLSELVQPTNLTDVQASDSSTDSTSDNAPDGAKEELLKLLSDSPELTALLLKQLKNLT